MWNERPVLLGDLSIRLPGGYASGGFFVKNHKFLLLFCRIFCTFVDIETIAGIEIGHNDKKGWGS
jgi:hypothetical protein